VEAVPPSPSSSSSFLETLDEDEIDLTPSDDDLSSSRLDGDDEDNGNRTLKAAQHEKAAKSSCVSAAESQRPVALSGSQEVIHPLTKAPKTAPATSQLKECAVGKQNVEISKLSTVDSPSKQVRFHVDPSPDDSPTSSPLKQVRFSELVEEIAIPSNLEYDGSDEGSESSDSSHSSRNSNVDEEAHVLLQENTNPKNDLRDHQSTYRARSMPARSAESILHRHDRSPGQESPLYFEDRSSAIYNRAPRWSKPFGQHDTARNDVMMSAQIADGPPSDDDSEDSFEVEDLHKSRFRRQRMLSPLSRYASL